MDGKHQANKIEKYYPSPLFLIFLHPPNLNWGLYNHIWFTNFWTYLGPLRCASRANSLSSEKIKLEIHLIVQRYESHHFPKFPSWKGLGLGSYEFLSSDNKFTLSWPEGKQN